MNSFLQFIEIVSKVLWYAIYERLGTQLQNYPMHMKKSTYLFTAI